MFRNFINTLRRYTMASVLNIIGLSVAFAAFMVIMMQVNYELSFDKFHPKAAKIYKVDFMNKTGGGQTVVSRPFINMLGEESAQIEYYSILEIPWGKSFFYTEKNGSKIGFTEHISRVYADFSKIFDFNMLEGSADALNDPQKILIPKSFATKVFGDESAIGKTFIIGSDNLAIEVGGVFADLPENSQIKNTIYQKISDKRSQLEDGTYSWGQNNYFMYVSLVPGADPRAVETAFINRPDFKSIEEKIGEGKYPELKLISSLYYDNRNLALDHLIVHGNKDTTNVMIAIAFMILVIAAINFVNFSTSLAPMRMKSINMQKILGSLNGKLRVMLIAEAVGLCLLSFGVSLLMVLAISESSMKDITLSGISLSGNWDIVTISGAVAIVVGLIAGIYPALYTTKFAPVMVLKGSFAMSPRGRMLRTTLIGFQYVASIGLIVAAMFMQIQNRYMQSMNTGLNTTHIATAELGGKLVDNPTFKERLCQSPLIEDVAYAQYLIGGSDMSQGWGMKFKEEDISFNAHYVSWNFPKMMGLTLVEGEFFTQAEGDSGDEAYIFNEAASKKYNIHPGDQLGWDEAKPDPVKGIVKDFNYQSLHFAVEPMAMVLGDSWLPNSYIKIVGDPVAGVEYISKIAAEIDPTYPISISFYDKVFDNLYKNDQKTMKLISLFSFLAVIISLVGVFGLVVFETQYRRKEIGLRRINGATVGGILVMFNRKFVWLVGICFVVATPLAWYGVSEWLKGFAYQTPLYWWVFALALLIVLGITILTVTIQSWRAATENPVNSIKSE